VTGQAPVALTPMFDMPPAAGSSAPRTQGSVPLPPVGPTPRSPLGSYNNQLSHPPVAEDSSPRPSKRRRPIIVGAGLPAGGATAGTESASSRNSAASSTISDPGNLLTGCSENGAEDEEGHCGSDASNYFGSDDSEDERVAVEVNASDESGEGGAHPGQDGFNPPGPRDPPITPAGTAVVFENYVEFFSYFFLRGQRGVSEDAYNLYRSFQMDMHPAEPPPPSLSHLHDVVIPRVRKNWGLPLRKIPVAPGLVGAGTDLLVVLPSDHLARDCRFEGTYRRLCEADSRDEVERELHPEFVDSTFFKDRAGALRSGPVVNRFFVDGFEFKTGDLIDICTSDDCDLHQVCVGKATFADKQHGVGPGPGIHAGDIVVVIHGARDGSAQPQGLGRLVLRHWRVKDFGSMAWAPAGSDDNCNVRVTGVYPSPCSEHCAPREDPPLPVRRLSGEGTLTVFLIFFSDGFVSRQGRNASSGGVYMSYASCLFRCRTSRHAVRRLSVAPAGVDSDAVLVAITDDLVQGATSGWPVTDPEGRPLRVFADVAFYVGDYVQVSHTSHMRGHGARAPCPLCRYALPGQEGSQYGQDGGSQDTGMGRTSAGTLAIVEAVRQRLEGIKL